MSLMPQKNAREMSAPRPIDRSHPRTIPCGDHAFDEFLVCRCGATWWTHQRIPARCPLDARGQNRGTRDEA